MERGENEQGKEDEEGREEKYEMERKNWVRKCPFYMFPSRRF
jgi:hypothetical protein